MNYWECEYSTTHIFPIETFYFARKEIDFAFRLNAVEIYFEFGAVWILRRNLFFDPSEIENFWVFDTIEL